MIWNVALQKLLRHRDSQFRLDVAFASHAPHLALFGPSGAGKTQTLKMIAGISTPDTGRIVIGQRSLFDGQAAIDLRPQDRRLGYVFQDYALFPHLTVRQNIAFGRTPGWLNPGRTASGKAADEGATRWISAFSLQAQSDLYPHQISGGQRQRTALARALVNDPQALLLDEPFAALDRGLRQKLRQELRDLQADISTPTLLITHDEDDLDMLASEIVSMKEGSVVATLSHEQQRGLSAPSPPYPGERVGVRGRFGTDQEQP